MEAGQDNRGAGRLPPWLRRSPRTHAEIHALKARLRRGHLHTVCESARCPNLGRCFALPTATFLLLGDRCTRGCTFCNIGRGSVLPPDPDEPRRVAEAARDLGLRFVVLTSVTRDDLADGGAAHFAATVGAIRQLIPGAGVEVLVPDFRGHEASLRTVAMSRPDVFNHNVETVPRLYPFVRPEADFARSLTVIAAAKRIAAEEGVRIATKSGLMVGLGETDAEVVETMARLRDAGCDVLTIGQYLQPRRACIPVARYVHPDRFAYYAEEGARLGFAYVFSAPQVRSSFSAAEVAGHVGNAEEQLARRKGG